MADIIYPGNAQPSQVLSGQTFSSETNYNKAGTMPNRGAVTITPGPSAQSIPDGYHNGSGSVPGVSVPAANVLTGTTIAGTAGTMPNNGSLGTITPGTSNKTIPPGHTDGGTVAGDSNLIGGNIKPGISIFNVVSTMPSQASKTITPGTANQTAIPAGVYPTGAVTVLGDADLIPSNILSGKNIFGVDGNASPRQFASGSVNSGTNYESNGFTYTGGGTANGPYIIISGLGFTPSVILISATNGDTEFIVYSKNFFDNGGGTTMNTPGSNKNTVKSFKFYSETGNNTTYMSNYLIDSYIDKGGGVYHIPVALQQYNFTWIAFG